MAEENQSGFKVTDRRLFNPDGTLREDALVEEPPTTTATAFEINPVAQPAAAPPPPTPPPYQAPPQGRAAAQQAPEEDAAPEQTEFTEFLMRIASEAFIYLGLVEHPMTGRRQVDLPAAKESIDMLIMLRAKTQGNLTPGEARFFDDLLGELKRHFVSYRRQ
jgi:hypothetical protein